MSFLLYTQEMARGDLARKCVNIDEAIQKMTDWIASPLGLADSGFLHLPTLPYPKLTL